MMIEARAELVSLRNELDRVGGDIRTLAGQAEDRVSQTGRIAESMVLARAQAATAEAVRELTATATEISRLIAQEASVAEAHERLESVLARLRATDQRLRASDERTRRALGPLRAVPDEDDDPEESGAADQPE
jgi:chromosome segregation ATPase